MFYTESSQGYLKIPFSATCGSLDVWRIEHGYDPSRTISPVHKSTHQNAQSGAERQKYHKTESSSYDLSFYYSGCYDRLLRRAIMARLIKKKNPRPGGGGLEAGNTTGRGKGSNCNIPNHRNAVKTPNQFFLIFFIDFPGDIDLSGMIHSTASFPWVSQLTFRTFSPGFPPVLWHV